MSLLPYLIDDLYPRYQVQGPCRIQHQHFGLVLTPDDFLTAAKPRPSREYYRPWCHLAADTRDVGSSIKTDADNYQISLDVQQFAPDEISVKTVDGYIVVDGKHEEKKDEHGYISRQFTRRYALPEGTIPESVESKLSFDGVLTISAPWKVPKALKGERNVPIAQTGHVRKENFNQSADKSDKKEEK